jgi:hypothetical protein
MGKDYLNIYTSTPLRPAEIQDVDPKKHFPFLWHFLNGLFASPERRPLDYFLAWLQRFNVSFREYKPEMGQAIFLCGPKENGKGLLCFKIIKPLVGDNSADPFEHFTSKTGFNSELFKTGFLAIDDSKAPDAETRNAMVSKIKGFVVKPHHQYHAKYQEPVDVVWNGRIFQFSSQTGLSDPWEILPRAQSKCSLHVRSFHCEKIWSGWTKPSGAYRNTTGNGINPRKLPK